MRNECKDSLHCDSLQLKSESKDMSNVTKDYITNKSFELSVHQSILKKCITQKYIKQHNCFQH